MNFLSAAITILFFTLLACSLIAFSRYRLRINGMHEIQKALQKNIDHLTENLREALLTIELQQIELERAKKEVLQTHHKQTHLLAHISHEIRTSLNAIRGFTQLLLKDKLHPRQQEYADTIYLSSNHLLSIVTNILDFSKIESGKLVLENTPLNILNLAEEVLRLVTPLAHNKPLELITLIDSEIPQDFLGDALKLKQILINLVSNAIKFTECGTITFRISVEHHDTEKALLKITITDTGIGLSTEEKKIIFDPFSQANESTARRFGGTGLGLSISKYLAEQMGGTLGVESELGKGANFWLTVEMKIDTTEKSGPTLPLKAPLKILVVDDNLANLKLLCALLDDLNVITHACESGQEAIHYLMTHKVSLILMDIQMPNMNGIEATQHIRAMEKRAIEKHEHTPIIAVTAHALADEQLAAFEAGVDDYMTKPINDNQLMQLIQKWTGHPILSKIKNIKPFSAKTDSDPIKSEPVNLAESLSLANYKTDLAHDLLIMLLNSLPQDQSEIKAAWEEEDYPSILEKVHKLHGATRYCGVPLLREATHQAEILIKQKKYALLPDALKILFHEIDQIHLWVDQYHPDHSFYSE